MSTKNITRDHQPTIDRADDVTMLLEPHLRSDGFVHPADTGSINEVPQETMGATYACTSCTSAASKAKTVVLTINLGCSQC